MARKALINNEAGAKMCTTCHTPELSPSFNFDEYRKRGVHRVGPPPAPKKS